MSNELILKIENLSKSYPGVKALDKVSLEFRKGEVHALVGENGAGKSTLIKCISGAIDPDEGTVTVGGKSYSTMTPHLSQAQGISIIYQEFTLIPALSAAENVYLGQKTSEGALVNIREREKMAKEIFDQFQVNIDPSQTVRDLSPAYQQIIEIAKAVSRDVKLLIMDEPTAPLTVSEVELLFRIVRDLKSKGVTVIYISHRLEELFEVADRVSVLRDGEYITTKNIGETNRQDLISLMTGRELKENFPYRHSQIGRELLRVEQLSGNGVEKISFTLRAGEILGFAGLVGAGRTELMMLLFGAEKISEGKIYIESKEVIHKSPKDAILNGIGLIPEDRKQQGLFLRKSVKWNTIINAIRQNCRGLIVNEKAENRIAKDFAKRFTIKTPSVNQLAVNLSGGNQQKVVLAKTLAADTKLLIFDEPTRGIDVNAKQEIYNLMNELAEKGQGIILVSSEMPELLGMSDRIVVISEGKQTGTLEKSEFDQKKILDLASISA